MSAADFSTDDLFVIRIIKQLATNPSNRWANSYEVKALTAGGEADLLLLAQHIMVFEKYLHFPAVQFVQLIVSTWAPDSVPYNPESFISSAVTQIGARVPSSDPLPLNQTLSVARVCATGRFGHLFYRGCLEEADVNAPAGKAILSTPAAIQTIIDDALGESSFEENIGNPATGSFQLVMVSKSGSQIRPVIGLFRQGVSAVPQDHAWFNRTTTPTP